MSTVCRFSVIHAGSDDKHEIDFMAPPHKGDHVMVEIEGKFVLMQVVWRTIYARASHPDTGKSHAGVLHCVLVDG